MSAQSIHCPVLPATLLCSVAVAGSAGFGTPARAEPTSPDIGAYAGTLPDRLLESGAACGQALAGSGGADMNCMLGALGGFLVGAAAELAETQGRTAFGPRFQIVHRLSRRCSARG